MWKWKCVLFNTVDDSLTNWLSSVSCVCVCVCYSVRPSENNVSTPTFFPLDSLQKKLKELEEENKSLRSEVRTQSHTAWASNFPFVTRVILCKCIND